MVNPNFELDPKKLRKQQVNSGLPPEIRRTLGYKALKVEMERARWDDTPQNTDLENVSQSYFWLVQEGVARIKQKLTEINQTKKQIEVFSETFASFLKATMQAQYDEGALLVDLFNEPNEGLSDQSRREKRRYNHYSTVILAYDIARELGFKALKITSAADKHFLKIAEFYFDAAKGELLIPNEFGELYGSPAVEREKRSVVSLVYERKISYYLSYSEYRKAIRLATRAIDLIPSPEAYFLRGVAFRDSYKDKEALEDFKRVIELQPSYAEAYRECAKILIGMKSFEEALKFAQEFCNSDPTNPEGYYLLGLCDMGLDNYSEALEMFQKSLSVRSPTVVDRHLHVLVLEACIICSKRLGNEEEAESYRRRYLKERALLAHVSEA